MGWWTGGLFAAGSLCFASGSVPLVFDNVAPELVAATFFVGSIFFTSAAVVQFLASRNAIAGVRDVARLPGPIRRLSRPTDWWATAIQLVGTLCFNVSTFAATRVGFAEEQERRLIWAPDMFGSICFLVASGIAYGQVKARARTHTGRSSGWWIAAVNLAGSVAFGAAAIGARYIRTTGESANISLVNSGTFAGAICFLIGAALLPAESAKDA
jgi:hypothetical protein